MIYKGKYRIIGNLITACDYGFLTKKITESIEKQKSLLISPIASHTLVKSQYDKKLNRILSNFDYLVPDSQWVKRSISFLYGKDKKLDDRVYGPELMLKICDLSNKKNYKIFLYGNTPNVLGKLEVKLSMLFPGIKIVGKEESKFRELSKPEWKQLINKIIKSKAYIIFLSLGSPNQEIFSYRLSHLLNFPLVYLPVGAAFDFIIDPKKQAPTWMGKIGLEWLYRLFYEPKKLWIRYLGYGPLFILLVFLQKLNLLIKKYAKNN